MNLIQITCKDCGTKFKYMASNMTMNTKKFCEVCVKTRKNKHNILSKEYYKLHGKHDGPGRPMLEENKEPEYHFLMGDDDTLEFGGLL